MENHANLLLRLYGTARGRASEYWGGQYLDSDKWVRINDVPGRAEEWYRHQTPPFRENLDAFAAGVNEYARVHGDQVSADLKQVLPVSAVDVLAHVQRVIFFTFVVNRTTIARMAHPDPSSGSNGWALGPSKVADGHAILVANPHLPWRDLYTFFEAHLAGPGIDAYGATFVGFPVLGIAFNNSLGWTHTVNTIDAADLFELKESGDGYIYDGQRRDFEKRVETIRVRRDDGTLREEVLTVESSVQGPVVSERAGHPLALRVAGLDRARMCEEWWNMARAQNLGQFEQAVRDQQIPMFTIIYADRAGHILHLFNGSVPVRPPGPYDWSAPVPGWTSDTLWHEVHAFEALPRVLDPPSGWLQNSNDPPWTTTFPPPLDRHAYPTYMAPVFMGFRAQSAVKLLSAPKKLAFDEVIEAKYSTHVELADRVVNELIAAARASGHPNAQKAADVLATWDRAFDSASRGAVLFQQFVQRWTKRSPAFAVPWSEAEPLTTPRHLADPTAAVEDLEAAATAVSASYGRIDVSWGDVFRFRRDGLDFAGNGYTGDPYGVVRVIAYEPDGRGKFQAFSGDSYIAVVEFSAPLRAKVLLAYGNSSQPESRHRTDQLELASEKQLREAWFTPADINMHLERKEVF